MVELLFDIVVGMFGPGSARAQRRSRRRTARSFNEGRDVTFPGWVLGAPAYCGAPEGFLDVTSSGMQIVRPGSPPTRRDIPVERLHLLTTRPSARSDGEDMPDHWSVAECLDGQAHVLVACHREEMRYVEHALAAGLDRATRTI